MKSLEETLHEIKAGRSRFNDIENGDLVGVGKILRPLGWNDADIVNWYLMVRAYANAYDVKIDWPYLAWATYESVPTPAISVAMKYIFDETTRRPLEVGK